MSANENCIQGVEQAGPRAWCRGECGGRGWEVGGCRQQSRRALSTLKMKPQTLNMELQDLTFVLLGFGSCFGPVFPHCVPFSPFGNENVYSVPLNLICCCFVIS